MDSALIAKLLAAAIRLTELPALEAAQLPAFVPMSSEQITHEICPQRPGACQTLIALYEPSKRRIVYRDSLNLKLPKDQSFLFHELVHVLQYAQQGDAIFASCQSTMASEGQAYRAQDRFLGESGDAYRVSLLFRYLRCEDNNTPAVPSGRGTFFTVERFAEALSSQRPERREIGKSPID